MSFLHPLNPSFWCWLGAFGVISGLFVGSDHGNLSIMGVIAIAAYAILRKIEVVNDDER